MYLTRDIPLAELEQALVVIKNESLQSSDFILPLLNNSYPVIESLQPYILLFQELLNTWDILDDGDLVGYLYQSIESTILKKSKGQFFTPPEIIEHLLVYILKECTSIENTSTKRFLDPACGSGHFLLYTYKYLFKLYTTNGMSNKQAALTIITKNLHGFDIDPLAIAITKYNLSRISGVNLNSLQTIQQKNVILKDSPIFDAVTINENYYDIIIGNPPWGSSLSKEEKKYYRKIYSSAKSGINTFSLFIERSIELVKENGIVALLVPEALLNIKAHQKCREYLLENSHIKEIALWGERFDEVFAPAVSIIINKSSQLIKTNSLAIKDFSSDSSPGDLYISQRDLISTYQSIININYSTQTQDILSHINERDCFYLENRAQFFLGIVTGNNTHHIKNELSDEYPDKILIGKDLTPYKINYSGHAFSYDPEKLQQTAPQKLYMTPNKILYKFIGKRLTFALDTTGVYSLNSINGFIPDMNLISSEAMISILNSTLMQYFYEKKFFTLKALQNNLNKLPIKKLSPTAEKILSDYAKEMSHTTSLSQSKQIQGNIDDLVFNEYNLSDKQSYHIWEEYNSDKAQQILPGV